MTDRTEAEHFFMGFGFAIEAMGKVVAITPAQYNELMHECAELACVLWPPFEEVPKKAHKAAPDSGV